MKKILILCPYPQGEAASQRFKYEQYFNSWEKEGYSIKVSSFFDKSTWDILYEESNFIRKVLGTLRGYLRRFLDLLFLKKYDVIYIFLWVTPLGPPIFERLVRLLANKIVYDFDDSIFMKEERPKTMNLNLLSRTHDKCQYLIKHADHVILSSPFNLDYCLNENLYSSATYVPCSINTGRFKQKQREETYEKKLVLGWTGTFSTIPYLNLLKSSLISLNEDLDFKLLLITNFNYSFDEIDLEVIRWNKATEIEDLHRIDIGLYPVSKDKWALGKGGLKVMQYMSIGIPSVSTNHGTACNIINHGESGFLVNTDEEWIQAIKNLREDDDLRYRMGNLARKHVVENYSTERIESYYLEILDKL